MNYKDQWPGKIPVEKMQAYKKLIDSGDIQIKHVEWDHEKTIVEYEAENGIRQKLKEASG